MRQPSYNDFISLKGLSLFNSVAGFRPLISRNRRSARAEKGEEEIRELRGEAEALRADRDELASQARRPNLHPYGRLTS